VFHPQGGGQPSDVGIVTDLKSGATAEMTFAAKGEEAIRHYVSGGEWQAGTPVRLDVTWEPRERNARLHSAGHLLASVTETLCPGVTAQKGFHFPEGPYVEFGGEAAALEDAVARSADLERVANDAITKGGALAFSERSPGRREVAMPGFPAVPCGGTHVPTLDAIGAVRVRKAQVKKGKLRLSYDVS
jgi:Ser-tRNA(Ala) deacylase AlaX